MKLSFFEFNEPIVFVENKVNVLVIENPIFLRNLLFELFEQSKGNNGKLVLSNELDILDIQKAVEIIDPFNIEKNSKRIGLKILQHIIEISNDYPKEIQEALDDINELCNSILAATHFDISFSHLENIDQVLKLMNFNFNMDNANLVESIIEYIRIVSHLLEKKLIVFTNLKSIFSEHELKHIYDIALYEKINLFLIESHETYRLENEILRTIDNDLCEF